MSNALPDISGARCAHHPLAAASFTCSRCGNFACDPCRAASDPRLCQPCEARTAPRALPSDRPLTMGMLLRDVFQQLSRHLLAVGVLEGFSLLSTVVWALGLFVLMGAPSLESLAESGSPSLPRGFEGRVLLTLVLWVFLHCAGAAGFIRWIADGMRERGERSFPALVRAGLVGGTVIFLILVLYGVALFGTGMLMAGMNMSRDPLILPPTLLLALFIAVYISFASSLALAPAVLEAHGPLDAFRRSATLLKGHRLRVLGLYAILGTMVFGAFLLSIFVTGMLGTLGHLEAVGSILVLIVHGLSVGLFLIASTVVYVRLRPAEAPPSPSSQEAPAAILAPPDQSVSAARIETAEGEAPPLFRNH